VRSRAVEDMRIRGKYRQVIIDGTQLYSTRGELDEKSLYRIHQKGTEGEYRENYYYVLEAKLVLHPKIIVSFQTEFVENEDGKEAEKQDCPGVCGIALVPWVWEFLQQRHKAWEEVPDQLCQFACELQLLQVFPCILSHYFYSCFMVRPPLFYGCAKK